MKNLEEIRAIIEQHRPELEEQYKVSKIAIFGSYARGDQAEQSDVDILVDFKEPVGFLFIHLADYLEAILGLKVDLLTPDAIKPNRKKSVMEDMVYV